MPGENVDIVARIYEGWGRGDFTVGISDFDPDVTLVIDPEIPEAGVYHGPDGIRDYMTRFLEAWESLTMAADSLEDAGERVLAKVRQSGVGKDSGAAVTLDYFHVWSLRDGRVIRLETALSEEKARNAAGLPAQR